jgi:hypothetical protein
MKQQQDHVHLPLSLTPRFPPHELGWQPQSSAGSMKLIRLHIRLLGDFTSKVIGV